MVYHQLIFTEDSPLYLKCLLYFFLFFSQNYSRENIQDSEKKLGFHSSTEISNSGYFSLNWDSPNENAVFQLKMSKNSGINNSKIIYEGPDRGHFISGLKNGNYFFQLCELEKGGELSDILCASVLEIKVKHHPLNMALGFFVTGLLVFTSIIWVIIRGNAFKGDIA